MYAEQILVYVATQNFTTSINIEKVALNYRIRKREQNFEDDVRSRQENVRSVPRPVRNENAHPNLYYSLC